MEAQSYLGRKFWHSSHLSLGRFKTGTQALGGHASCLAISSHRRIMGGGGSEQML